MATPRIIIGVPSFERVVEKPTVPPLQARNRGAQKKTPTLYSGLKLLPYRAGAALGPRERADLVEGRPFRGVS
jgi:hypothetical protein